MLGLIDRDRIHRAFDYLSILDRARIGSGCHSVYLNSFAQMQLARVQAGSYNIAICRRVDQCLVVYFTALDGDENENVVDRIESEMQKNGHLPKCGICTGVASKKEYCELCSIMVTNVEEVCAICLEDERKLAVWVDPGCGHCYHHECLTKIRDNKCPLCRKVIKESKIV